MVRAVLFDLDGTLYDRDAALRRFVRDQHRRLELTVDLETYLARFIDLDQRGRVWKDRVYAALGEEFSLAHSPESLLQDYEEGFGCHCVPFAGTQNLLQDLRERGVKLGLISNGRTEFQLRTLRALGLEPFFDATLISEAVGLRKPDPAIFTLALQQLGVEPSEAVFVGDDPDADVRGAKAAGLRAYWIASPYHVPPVEANGVLARIEEIAPLLLDLPFGECDQADDAQDVKHQHEK